MGLLGVGTIAAPGCGDGGYLRRGVGRARGWRGWGGPKGVGFRFISFPVGGFIYDCEEDDCEIASPKAPRFCSSGLSGAKVAEPRLAANSDVDDAARRHVDSRSAWPSDVARRVLQDHGVLQRVRVAGLKNHAVSPFCGSVGVRRPQTSRTCAMPPRTLRAYRSGPRVASRPIERPSRGLKSRKRASMVIIIMPISSQSKRTEQSAEH